MTFAKRDTADLDSVYYFIKTDSTSISGTDSIFYFNEQLNYNGTADCLYQNGYPTLLGKKMILKSDPDATHVFFNMNGDSIFIKTQIDEGYQWHIYNWPNGTYVQGTVINKFPRTVLPGIEDTVLRIQLNVVNVDGVTLTDTFPNQTKFDITQNYGIIEFFNFNLFPLSDDSMTVVLRGLDNPDQGIVDVDAESAYNFETGYEFHYREEVVPDLTSGGDRRVSAWKYFVMEKSPTPDGVDYTMERILFDTIWFGGAPTSTITFDTIIVPIHYSDVAFLDTLEYCHFVATHDGYSDWIKNDSLYKAIEHKWVYDWFNYDEGTLCLSNPDNISMPEQLYGRGLGLMHYLDSTDITNYYKLDMVYFHLGLLEWGIPYDFSDLDYENILTTNNNSELKIYPNPSSDWISLSTLPELFTGTLYIYANSGQIIKSVEDVNKNSIINTADLSSGMYFIRLENNTGNYSGKFIKD